MKKTIVIVWLALILSLITYLFWHNEWKYTLPAPVPVSYKPPENGDNISFTNELFAGSDKPSFLHFFNPECPCSKFNIPEYKSLVKKYGDKINFAIVVMNSKKRYTEKKIQRRFDLTVPVLFDSSLADLCGVYCTPQAVILDSDHKLYYRGNYNKSRFCTSKNSNYAQMAIDSMLTNIHKPVFNQYALQPYGCEFPNCTK